jgi:hypothetical protein
VLTSTATFAGGQGCNRPRPRSRRTTSTGRCRPPYAAARPHARGARDGGVAMEDEEPVDSPTATIVDRALPHPATPCVPPVACPASLLWICIGGGVAVPVPPRCIGLDARVSAAAAASACGRPRGVPSPRDTVAKGAGAAMASTCDRRWLAPSLPGVRDLERPTLIQQLRLSTLGTIRFARLFPHSHWFLVLIRGDCGFDGDLFVLF